MKHFIPTIIILLLSVALKAQRPMSYKELLPKIDSINNEQHKIEYAYLLNSYMNKRMTDFTNSQLLSSFVYFRNDTAIGLILNENNDVINECKFQFPSNLPKAESDILRKLKKNEFQLFENQIFLITRFKSDLKNHTNLLFSEFVKIVINEVGLTRMYAIHLSENNNDIPLNNNFIYIKHNDKLTIHQHRMKSNTNVVFNQKGDTTKLLLLNCKYPDLFIYPLDIFVFKTFAPKWWLSKFRAYSRKNNRYFEYNIIDNNILIEKFPNEK